MDIKGFSVGEELKFGWEAWKKRWAFLIGIVLFSMILPLIPQLILAAISETADLAKFVLSIIHFVLAIIASMGFWTIAIKAARQEPYSFSDFFSTVHLFPSFLWAQILFLLVVAVGLVLFIIPGIIFALKFCLYPFFVLDRSFKGIESLKASNQAVYGKKWDLLVFMIVVLLLDLLGLLVLGIGLLITVPVTTIAWAHVYVKLTTPLSEIA